MRFPPAMTDGRPIMRRGAPLLVLALFGIFLECHALRLPENANFTPEQISDIEKKYGQDFDMVENYRAQNVLLAALAKKQKRDFMAFIEQPMLVTVGKMSSCQIENHIDSDGYVLTRIDCFAKPGELSMTLLRNRRGDFVGQSDKWVQVDEILDLSFLTAMTPDFHEAEIRDSVFTMQETSYFGRPCDEVTMKVLMEPRALNRQNPEMPLHDFADKDFRNPSFQWRPMVRIFVIDRETGFVFSVKHFNVDGSCIFSRNAGKIDLDFQSSAARYSMPGKVYGKCPFMHEAIGVLTGLQQEQAAALQSRRLQGANRFPLLDALLRNLRVILLICGVLFFGTAIYFKIQK